ncbi:MAG: MFS transporter [Candidatus Bathyarchaeota archaeon]|nr:MAG: MFS transporter [Candidatus Bathyarchaeota archaeon]
MRTCGFVLPLTGSVTQAAGVVGLRSVGANISMPAQRALLADIAPAENRGRYFGIFGTAFTAGMVAGPIFGTSIYSLYRFSTFNLGGLVLPGYGIPFFINSILGFLATIMLLIWVKETKTRTGPSGPSPHGHPH